jgi:hypothetical protein
MENLFVSSAANGVKVWEYQAPASRNTPSSENQCRLLHHLSQEEAYGSVDAVCWSEDGEKMNK